MLWNNIDTPLTVTSTISTGPQLVPNIRLCNRHCRNGQCTSTLIVAIKDFHELLTVKVVVKVDNNTVQGKHPQYKVNVEIGNANTGTLSRWSFTLSLGDLAFDTSCRSLTAKLLELMDMGGVAMVVDLKVGSGNHLMKQMCLWIDGLYKLFISNCDVTVS
ncbi:hypothetical protein BgiBS90_009052 [Biomphalaria glabrata]|nr:hypothetical protein BgiBS90_009052 [Biomphalaria glabrata]